MSDATSYSKLTKEAKDKMIARRSEIRRESRDRSVGACGIDKSRRIDLGLAILHCLAHPGVSYTHKEIAAFCGCTDCAIYSIEQIALRKIRNMLMFRDPELRAAFFDHLFVNRSPAKRTTTMGGRL